MRDFKREVIDNIMSMCILMSNNWLLEMQEFVLQSTSTKHLTLNQGIQFICVQHFYFYKTIILHLHQ